MSRALVVVSLVVSLHALGCKKPEGTPQPADAGPANVPTAQADAAPAPPRDRTLRVVAESVGKQMSLDVLPDGRVVVLAGPIAYEASPDGSLAPLGGLGAYVSMVPADETFVGYVEQPQHIFEITTAGGTDLFFTGNGPAFRLEKGKFTRDPAIPAGHRPLSWSGKVFDVTHEGFAWLSAAAPAPVPAAIDGRIEAKTVDARGALVILSSAPDGKSRAMRAFTYGKPGEAASVADLPLDGLQGCRVVPAFDRELYASCTKGEAQHAFKRFDGGVWREVFADVKRQGSVSIGPDHALYAAAFEKTKLEVKRCPAGGAPCIALATDVRPPTANAASYQSHYSDVQDPESYKSWQTFAVERGNTGYASAHVDAVVARTEDDVWALVVDGPAQFLLHSGPSRPVQRIGNELDARFLLRNREPPQPWVGHCEQLFVRLGPAKDEQVVAARAKEIAGIVTPLQGKDYEQAFTWAIVTGRLHDQEVVGVVLVRGSFDGSLANLERAAERLVEKLAKNPVDKPRVTCTLPVLDQLVEPRSAG